MFFNSGLNSESFPIKLVTIFDYYPLQQCVERKVKYCCLTLLFVIIYFLDVELFVPRSWS